MPHYIKRVTDPKAVNGKGRRFTEDTKKSFVRDVLSGNLTRAQAMIKYDIHASQSAANWMEKYGSIIEQQLTPKPMSTEQMLDIELLRKRNAELELALENARIKVFGLETMIDIADAAFKSDIRKKHGTKQ